MELFTTVREMRAYARSAGGEGEVVALVPTMGALHEGHLRLIEHAAAGADKTVVSIFVNRTQFGPNEDFDAYPRTLEADTQTLLEQGLAHAVFAPSDREMYADLPQRAWISVDRMADRLCGASRPGHFRGVTTIVAKLLNVCAPRIAVFGLKDAQQFFLIRKMVADLNMDVDIQGVPTVREKDGLALSSRNRYLTSKERGEAVVLSRSVFAARRLIEEGEKDAEAVRSVMRVELERAGLGRIDYCDVVSASDFYPVSEVPESGTLVAAVAVFFGKARLIDNAIIELDAL